MALTLKDSQALTELADLLYSFLPGTPHPYADPSLSFPGVAAKLGLAHHWPGGSKGPAITRLLTGTLESDSARSCPLLLAIIRNAMNYRINKEPISRVEIETLNTIIQRIGYKIPELHDSTFLDGLPRNGKVKNPVKNKQGLETLSQLQKKLTDLQALEPVKRGFGFEIFLSDLFDVFDLAPRGSFRLTGERIDGSFKLDGEVYLLEARWRNEKAAISDLLTFSGKVGGKAQWSRGLFVSYVGFTEDGLQAFRHGRQTNLIGLDGLDLYHVLSGNLDLQNVLRLKVRRAAETNRDFVPVRELRNAP